MNSKKNFLAAIVWGICFIAGAQTIEKSTEVVRSIADKVLADATFNFKNGEGIVDKLTADNYSTDIKIASPYNEWRYWNGVLNIAMVELGETLNEDKYTDFALRNYEFAFDHYEIFEQNNPEKIRNWKQMFYRLYLPKELDDCGAEAGGLIEVYEKDPQPRYMEYLKMTADHMLNKQDRLADGTLVRKWPHEMTLWADDLYMSVVFLARMGRLTGDDKYFDDAIMQVKNFNQYLWNASSELYYHTWYSDTKTNGVAHWGRCNGWVALAVGDLIDNLPKDHPARTEMIDLFKTHLIGLSRYQSPSGLWHQLLDHNDSYLETSATSMFVYSVARAVNNNWIEKRYMTIALEGWKGLMSKVREDGQVEDICIGTGIKDDLIFYYKRPTKLNDIHGLGAVLLAGMEVLRYQQKEG